MFGRGQHVASTGSFPSTDPQSKSYISRMLALLGLVEKWILLDSETGRKLRSARSMAVDGESSERRAV